MIMTQGSFQDLRWAKKYQIKYLKEGKWFSYQKADGTLVSGKKISNYSKNQNAKQCDPKP